MGKNLKKIRFFAYGEDFCFKNSYEEDFRQTPPTPGEGLHASLVRVDLAHLGVMFQLFRIP